MSCPCPSGYTPTIDSDDCILTVTAATSGGSFFYTATTGSLSSSYCSYGTIFYEDITELSFPISNSATTTTAYTENGTTLINTQFLLDDNGRILNIQAGGQGIPNGPQSLKNTLWGSGSTVSGRINNAGIWTTINPNPINEFIGFSYCLDIPISGTYYIGIGGDDLLRFKLNGELIFFNVGAPVATSMPQNIGANTWSVFPYTFNSGLNIIEMECLNLGGPASFAAEIYSGSVETLSGYTSYSELSANTLFSTVEFIGDNIPLSASGGTTGTGYTCPEGYALYNCTTGSPYCVMIDREPIVNYCISDTGLGYDDYFKYGGEHNAEPYWTGITTNRFIYFTTGGTWCLSDTLDGSCLLEGQYPCVSECPDLCEHYVISGMCPTTTTTTTIDCTSFDFDAIFDCEVTPTPTVTPTISTTPTPTPTPSTSSICSLFSVDVTISGYTPTPTPTTSPTPTPTPDVTRSCSVSGNVTFLTVDGYIECPNSLQFQDCINGQMYYSPSKPDTPSGDTLDKFMIFKADVDGISRCISYLGINLDVIGNNEISLVDGPLGYSNLGECVLCTPDVTPTPTPTPTPSITPTNTPTPTPSVATGYYVYRQCNNPNVFVVQTTPTPTYIVGQVFSTNEFDYCWEFYGYYMSYPTLPLGSIVTNYIGSYFSSTGNTFYDDCVTCLSSF